MKRPLPFDTEIFKPELIQQSAVYAFGILLGLCAISGILLALYSYAFAPTVSSLGLPDEDDQRKYSRNYFAPAPERMKRD